MKRARIASAGFLALSLFAAACSSGSSETDSAAEAASAETSITTMPATAEETETEPMEASEESAESGTIVDVAAQAGSFATLLTAAAEAGLVDTLQAEGPFTVFAPTDEAFAALPEGILEGLLADPAALSDILLYHVVAGEVVAADVVDLDSATSVEGSEIAIEIVDGKVVLNDSATVVTTDILASNGIIHVIDAVILPPAA